MAGRRRASGNTDPMALRSAQPFGHPPESFCPLPLFLTDPWVVPVFYRKRELYEYQTSYHRQRTAEDLRSAGLFHTGGSGKGMCITIILPFGYARVACGLPPESRGFSCDKRSGNCLCGHPQAFQGCAAFDDGAHEEPGRGAQDPGR